MDGKLTRGMLGVGVAPTDCDRGPDATGAVRGVVGWAGPDRIWIGRAGGMIGVSVWAPAPEQTSATHAVAIRARRIDKDCTTFSVRPF